MTIERPMFPPRAESVDSFSVQCPPGDRPDEMAASDAPKLAQEPGQSATILELRRPAMNLPRPLPESTGDGPCSPWRARSEREEKSRIIKAAVAYCCSKSTAEAGFIADHTSTLRSRGVLGLLAVSTRVWPIARCASW
jgi:hypothetical protein